VQLYREWKTSTKIEADRASGRVMKAIDRYTQLSSMFCTTFPGARHWEAECSAPPNNPMKLLHITPGPGTYTVSSRSTIHVVGNHALFSLTLGYSCCIACSPSA